MSHPFPSKIVCVGRNYAKHAAELGNDVPDEPLIFLKPSSSLIGPGEAIVIPGGVGRVDFEGEIGLIVGSTARYVRQEDAWDHVAAVVPVNDVTARDLQRKDDQWTRAKGFDTFCAVGTPVPTSGLALDDLAVTTRVNGKLRQEGHVSDLAFSITFLIEYISRIMTLNPGDLIATGTPDGIGPLSAGDTVEVRIPGVGSLSNPVAAES